MREEVTQTTETQHAPAVSEAHEFLELLFQNTRGFVEIRFIAQHTRHPEQLFYHNVQTIDWHRIGTQNRERQNVYFGVCARRVRRGREEDVNLISAYWADLDADDFPEGKEGAWEAANSLPQDLKPSLITDSGHGYHVYWLFTEPVLAGEAAQPHKETLRSLAKHLGGDLKSTDLARVLRLLGFINWKDANHPVRAKIIDWSPERRYSPEDFAHFKAQATEGRRESVKDKDRRYQDLPERIRQAAVLKVRQTCAFMRHCEEDAQSLPYADWFAMVSQLAWFAEVGRKAAHELSEPYDRGSKRYTPEETDKVFDSVLQGAQNGKGPQTCEHIENIVGFPCPHDCPAKSIAMSTPAGLAVHLATAEARNQEHNEAIQQVVQEQSKMEKPRLDDIGNGERFARQHKGKVVWVPEWGWLLWDGKRWRRDAGEVAELAKHTARSIFQEASLERDSEQAKAIAKHAMRTASKNQRDAMVDAAKTEPGILAHVGEFDKDPWLLNCQNGVLDLRDGRLMKHDPALRMTKLANAAYDPEKLCPEWTKFLNTVFEGNQDIIRFVQKATGFSLTGIPPDRVLFMLHGPGGNGKTTLVNTLTNILGDYADDTPPETLAVKRHEQIPNDIAKLHGKRLVTTSELTEGKALNEAIIKKMTGRGRMSARFLHREWFDFTPIHKLWVDTNHKPVIRETSKAIWDRIKLVPFTVTFNEETQDQGLPARLLTESNGILTWMVQGCFLWQQEGLKTPDRVRAATDDYRREMDSIEQFIDDCCVVEATASVKSSTLYEFFRTWASDNGEYTLSGKKFSNRLVEKGFEKKKAKNGVQFCGLGLPVTGVNSGG